MTKNTSRINFGNSSEYEVSIISGHNIYKAIDKDKLMCTQSGSLMKLLSNEEESFKVLGRSSYQLRIHKVHNISNNPIENLPKLMSSSQCSR